ncbi:MAG: complex I subunit 1/NuoH family protein, partial [Phycisphaerae bacterium]
MSRFYVPWPQREPKRWTGVSARIASVAIRVAEIAGPILKRYPGVVFTSVVIVGCLKAWTIAIMLGGVNAVSDALVAAGHVDGRAVLTLDQIATGKQLAGVGWPTAALWVLQFSLLRDLLGLLGVVTFASLIPIFGILAERKVSAFLQSRLGPTQVGGWHGWSQSIADGIKLIGKEDTIPASGDAALFRLAPYLCFVPAVLAFVALPFGAYWVLRDLDVALLFILAMLGIDVIGILIAGWASANKWSVYGAMREACQLVSYEIPMGISLLIVVMAVGSLRLNDFAAAQAGGWSNWMAFHSPWTMLAMLSYFIASLAACKRAPFDLPEAESELVAGFHAEYSGFRWSLFFFAEYCAMFVVSGVLVILFLGAWDAPWAGLEQSIGAMVGSTWLAGLSTSREPVDQFFYGVLFSGPLWFVLKCCFFIYVQIWLRWTLPRIRIDQVLYTCVQVLLPLNLAVLCLAAVWELARRQSGGFAMVADGISILLSI